jgi:hypothetical protein
MPTARAAGSNGDASPQGDARRGGGAGDQQQQQQQQRVWDTALARDELDEWLQAPGAAARLRALLVPATEREAEMAGMRAREPGRFESRLEERVWAELRGAAECLGGGGGSGSGTPRGSGRR